jgi:hypothetical protein
MKILPDKEKVQKLSVTSGAFLFRGLGNGILSPPAILLFPALKEVTVCSEITHASHYFEADYIRSHLGKCIPVPNTTSCFPKNNRLTITPRYRARQILNIPQSFFLGAKIIVNDFLEELRGGELPGVTWQEPSFRYRGLCLKSFDLSEETFFCPPRPKKERKAASRRVSENIGGVNNAISQ